MPKSDNDNEWVEALMIGPPMNDETCERIWQLIDETDPNEEGGITASLMLIIGMILQFLRKERAGQQKEADRALLMANRMQTKLVNTLGRKTPDAQA